MPPSDASFISLLPNQRRQVLLGVLPLVSLLIWLAFRAVLPVQAQQARTGQPAEFSTLAYETRLSAEVGELAASTVLTDTPLFVTAYFPAVFKPVPRPEPDLTPRDHLLCSNILTPIEIPDDNPAGTTDTLLIDNWRFIRDLDVYLDLEHSRVGDLRVSLVHLETGIQVPLFDRPGFPDRDQGCGGSDVISIFDDEASQPAEDKCSVWSPSISGSFQPALPLNAYISDTINGQWVLNVADEKAGAAGYLKSWCLDVTLQETIPTPPTIPPAPDLPSEAWVNGVSGQNQAMPLDCETRSAVDWARFFGTWINEYTFFSQLPISDNPDSGFVGDPWGYWGQIPPWPYGVHAAPVAELLRDYGLPAYAHRNLSWNDLRAEIAAGRPVITWVIGKSDGNPPGRYYPVYYTPSDGSPTVVSPYEHTVIVFGYNHNSVWIQDGALVYTRTVDEFLDSWSVLRNMAILAHE